MRVCVSVCVCVCVQFNSIQGFFCISTFIYYQHHRIALTAQRSLTLSLSLSLSLYLSLCQPSLMENPLECITYPHRV